MRPIWIGRALAVAAVLALTISTSSASETHVSAKAKLSGFQESPPKLTSGTGSFSATISGDKLSYVLTFSGLSSPASMSHIHFGQSAVNGGIFIWLCGSAGAPGPAGTPTCPAGGGTVSHTVTAADVQSVAAQNVNAGDFNGAIAILKSGDAYVNVHTTNFPAGEIRGQVRITGED
jgi:hypothetical protein